MRRICFPGERVLARRAQIGDEVNVIGTASLRLDVLPKATQPEIREQFRHHLDLPRWAVQALPDRPRAETLFTEAAEVQMQIRDRALAATGGGTMTPASQVLLPALNAMSDEQTTARIATLQHPPAATPRPSPQPAPYSRRITVAAGLSCGVK